MLKWIALGLLLSAIAFAIYIATQPSAFSVRREAVIPAPPDVVFAQVNDFHKWQAWSPWAKLDPNAKAEFAGPTSGTGAIFGWAGNAQVGEGKMTITESVPNDLIRMRLEFLKPWPATNQTLFTFKPDGKDTRMNWEMSGHNNFFGRAMCFFMNMDKMVGTSFEQGMTNIAEVLKANR